MGSVLFRLLVAMALRWGLNPNDLKLDHRGLRLRARLIVPQFLREEAAAERTCLKFKASARHSMPDTPNEVRALRGGEP